MRRIIKKKFNISVLFYVICAIMIVIIIPCAADIFEDMYRINGRMSGYEEDSLYQDFIDGSYDTGFCEKFIKELKDNGSIV